MILTSIKLIVTGAAARAEVDGLLTSGMVGIPVTIQYDSAWDGLTKNLVCRSKYGGTRVVLGIENTATVPHEVMTHEEWWYCTNKLEIGVEGINADGKLVFPTVYADCGVIREGADSDADPSADPTLPVWAKLRADMEQLKQNVVTAEQITNVVADYLEENPVKVPDSGGNANNAENGATFMPSVTEDGVLSWTNDKGLDNPAPVNIMGPAGYTPVRGKDYWNATDISEIQSYVDGAVKKAAPRNLLDNSDFTNPVNQRGVTAFESDKYGIDRWVCGLSGFTATVQQDGIHIHGSSGGFWLKQIIAIGGTVKIGAKLTLAVKRTTGILTAALTIPSNGADNAANPLPGNVLQLTTSSDGRYVTFAYFGNNDNEEYIVEWTALYEGEYTAETLPEYQPKGYGVELAECMRYYWRYPNNTYSNYCYYGIGTALSENSISVPVNFPVPMRLDNPSISASGNFRLLDKTWSIPVPVVLVKYDQLSLGINNQSAMLSFQVGGGLSIGELYHAQSNNDPSAFVEFSADL